MSRQRRTLRCGLGGLGWVGLLVGCFVDAGLPAGGDTVTTTTTTTSSTGELETSVGASGNTAVTTTTTPMETSAGSSGALSTSGLGATSTGAETGTTQASSSTGGVELPVPGCDPLFYADFSQEPSELTLEGDWKWDAVQGEMVVNTPLGLTSNAWVTTGMWTNFTVYARARVDSGSGSAAVRARAQFEGMDRYYHASLRPMDPKQIRVGKVINGIATGFITTSEPVDPNAWHIIRFELLGSDLTMAVDDGMIYPTVDAELTSGTVAIGGFDGSLVRFDWMLVCAV